MSWLPLYFFLIDDSHIFLGHILAAVNNCPMATIYSVDTTGSPTPTGTWPKQDEELCTEAEQPYFLQLQVIISGPSCIRNYLL